MSSLITHRVVIFYRASSEISLTVHGLHKLLSFCYWFIWLEWQEKILIKSIVYEFFSSFFNWSRAVPFWLEWEKFIICSIGAKNYNGKNNINESYETYNTIQFYYITEEKKMIFFLLLFILQSCKFSAREMIYLKWTEYQDLGSVMQRNSFKHVIV